MAEGQREVSYENIFTYVLIPTIPGQVYQSELNKSWMSQKKSQTLLIKLPALTQADLWGVKKELL